MNGFINSLLGRKTEAPRRVSQTKQEQDIDFAELRALGITHGEPGRLSDSDVSRKMDNILYSGESTDEKLTALKWLIVDVQNNHRDGMSSNWVTTIENAWEDVYYGRR